jgi:hypothetical protein
MTGDNKETELVCRIEMVATSPQVTQIQLTDEERISGIPNSLNIQNALAALHRDGTSTDLSLHTNDRTCRCK